MTDLFRQKIPGAWSDQKIYDYIRDTFPPGDGLRRTVARGKGLAHYPGECQIHGETPFSVTNGACVSCRKSKRSVARATGQKHYLDACEKHGETPHRVDSGTCQACRTENPRGKKPTLRSHARREGKTTFLEVCTTHGVTPHSVQSGKCLTCFTSAGAPRAAEPDALSPRKVARRTEQTTYAASCDRHGPAAPHSTLRGLCLQCFNTIGAPRKRPA